MSRYEPVDPYDRHAEQVQDGKDFAISFGIFVFITLFVLQAVYPDSFVGQYTLISMIAGAAIGAIVGWFFGISLPPTQDE